MIDIEPTRLEPGDGEGGERECEPLSVAKVRGGELLSAAKQLSQ